MAQTESLQYYDQREATKAKAALQSFVDKINTWIVQASENGLPIDHKKLFEYIEEPGKIRKDIDKQAKHEAKATAFQAMKNQIYEAAEQTTTELTQSLNKCFVIQTAEHMPNEQLNKELILKLKDHFYLSGNQLRLNDSFEPIVDSHHTYTPDNVGSELYKSLQKAIAAVQKHNDKCVEVGLPEYRINIADTAKNNPGLNPDGDIINHEFCTKSLKHISERNLKQLREQAKRPKVGTPTGKEPDSYQPSGGKPASKKNPLFPSFTIR